MNSIVVGRLAPSPTGAQHLGNARTYLIAWLAARASGGKVLMRIEDIDSPRVKPWAIQQAMDDLAWLGLDWDAGPDRSDRTHNSSHGETAELSANSISYIQTDRIDRYRYGLKLLQQQERIYPCTCSRTDIEQAASAPHRVEGSSLLDRRACISGTMQFAIFAQFRYSRHTYLRLAISLCSRAHGMARWFLWATVFECRSAVRRLCGGEERWLACVSTCRCYG
jgi:glutamyl/glutaminyl-tRNA synthetase